MIILKSINKTIKSNEVLRDINYTFKEGNLYLVEGHNGCGKTMLLRLICGLIQPTTGTITYDGTYDFGAIIENPTFVETETGMENLKFLASINKRINNDKILTALELLKLTPYKDKKVKTYSLGMKQRLAICQAIMENQNVILLDEPFNALDKESYMDVINLVNNLKENRIIIIAAHNIDKKDLLKIDAEIKLDNGAII